MESGLCSSSVQRVDAGGGFHLLFGSSGRFSFFGVLSFFLSLLLLTDSSFFFVLGGF